MRPVVSVICLCYNQKPYLKEAVDSVLKQTYDALQIILVDDASIDGSQNELKRIAQENPQLDLILLSENVGNCKAFNIGLKKATGDFIIDFATDDVMLPRHIEKVISHFQQLDESYGVVFTDATYVDEKGNALRNHFDYLLKRKLIKSVPQGDVFRNVLTTYFIPGPTTVIRKKVMDELGGYDETLAYEDFDFWIRSSRIFNYSFLNENLFRIRKTKTSMSSGLYRQGDRQLHSTYLICKKTKALCRDEEDLNALRQRVLYEFKQAFFSENRMEAKLFAEFLAELKVEKASYYLLRIMNAVPFPWRLLRKFYYQLKYT
jgi:glycosyltransferase involved in cell wall biosynthesis